MIPYPRDMGAQRRFASAWTAWTCALLGFAHGVLAQPAESPPGTPALYVVDATNTLKSFDEQGNELAEAKFKTEVGTLTGAMALYQGRLYAASAKAEAGNATGRVFAYNATTLKQVALHLGAFKAPAGVGDIGTIRAMVYEPGSDRFYVASELLGLLVFDHAGGYVSRAGASAAASALAYDTNQHVLWGIVDRHVVKFSADGSDPLPGLAALGAQYRHGRGAVALAYCPGAGDGALGSLAVAFGASGLGPRSVDTARTYDAGGKPIGTSYGGKIVNAHAMACSSRSEVFIAADNGLLRYTVQGAQGGAHSSAQQLTAPIYGVLAAN
jgi:hypothetical protein